MNKTIGLHAHKCDVCGAEFECTSTYIYKKSSRDRHSRNIYYCSYSCMREAEKEEEKNRSKPE